MLCAVEGEDTRRCACGARLSRYNLGTVCGPCERTLGDEWVRLAQQGPICREVGCVEPICERSLATNAPRWRTLCEAHYDEQRRRNSEQAQAQYAQRMQAAAG